MTKDERFLIEVYQMAHETGDLEAVLDPEVVAQKLGVRETQLKGILNGLQRANFLIRLAPGEIALTAHGISLAEQLIRGV